MKQIIARILKTANTLDEKGLYLEADKLTKIAQEMQQGKTLYNRVMSNMHMSPETRRNQGLQAWELDTIQLTGTPEDNGLQLVSRDEIPNLGAHWKEQYEIPNQVYTTQQKDVVIWTDDMENQQRDEEGPTDEQLFGQHESNHHYQQMMDDRNPETDFMRN